MDESPPPLPLRSSTRARQEQPKRTAQLQQRCRVMQNNHTLGGIAIGLTKRCEPAPSLSSTALIWVYFKPTFRAINTAVCCRVLFFFPNKGKLMTPIICLIVTDNNPARRRLAARRRRSVEDPSDDLQSVLGEI